jgi:hypothetical protein
VVNVTTFRSTLNFLLLETFSVVDILLSGDRVNEAGSGSIINHFLEENEVNLENSTGLCTDGAQSMSGRNTGLSGPGKK